MRHAAASLQGYVDAHPKACTTLEEVPSQSPDVLVAYAIATVLRMIGQGCKIYII